jgi:hypothetical protein
VSLHNNRAGDGLLGGNAADALWNARKSHPISVA